MDRRKDISQLRLSFTIRRTGFKVDTTIISSTRRLFSPLLRIHLPLAARPKHSRRLGID